MNHRGRPPRRGIGVRNENHRRQFWRDINARREVEDWGDQELPIYRLPIRYEVDTHSLGPMTDECIHCGALHFVNESTNGHYNSCCHNGLIHLPQPHNNNELNTTPI